MSTRTFEGFSVTHAAILDGTTTADQVGVDGRDFVGVRSGAVALDTNSYDNTGDDNILSTWAWINFATLTISSGYIPFQLIALMSGSVVTSSGTAPNDYYSVPLWNQKSMNQSPKPVMIRIPSKDTNGVVRVMEIILYKVQFNPFTLDGPNYKDGLLVNYSGKALMSTVDEIGTVLVDPAVGRIVNHF